MLKKDAVVQIPSHFLHHDQGIWGDSVQEFQPRRFMQYMVNANGSAANGPATKTPHLNRAAFRAFGGGSSLCPGRHFAMTELLSYVAMATMRFDLVPEGGRWIDPVTDESSFAVNVPGPVKKIPVVIVPRKDISLNDDWEFELSKKGTRFNLPGTSV